jgi:hypothetical protein
MGCVQQEGRIATDNDFIFSFIQELLEIAFRSKDTKWHFKICRPVQGKGKVVSEGN